jgi:hypothetical protein
METSLARQRTENEPCEDCKRMQGLFLTSEEAGNILQSGGKFRNNGKAYYVVGGVEFVQPSVVDRLIMAGQAKRECGYVVRAKLHAIRDLLADSETLRTRVNDLELDLDRVQWVASSPDERTVRKAIHTADQALGTIINWFRTQLAAEEQKHETR